MGRGGSGWGGVGVELKGDERVEARIAAAAAAVVAALEAALRCCGAKMQK